MPQEQLPGGLQHLASAEAWGDSVHSAIYRAVLGIWRTEQAPQDFKQGMLLQIPKKGNASLCSNYRTITLQSIAGKAYANVLSARLSQWLSETCLTSNAGSDQAGALLTPCSACKSQAMGLGTKARLCTYACWT